jgi:hypothetical protein
VLLLALLLLPALPLARLPLAPAAKASSRPLPRDAGFDRPALEAGAGPETTDADETDVDADADAGTEDEDAEAEAGKAFVALGAASCCTPRSTSMSATMRSGSVASTSCVVTMTVPPGSSLARS